MNSLLASGGASQGTLELLVNGERLQGTALAYSPKNVIMLCRDGKVVQFAPNKAKEFRQLPDRFAPFSANVMRGRLEREFGPAFEVSSTAHMLVVHPRGQKQHWVERFEEMFRSFQMYFSVRGFKLKQPQFPLVVIIFANESDFRRYAAKEGTPVGAGMLGYYSPATNQVVMYDVGDGDGSKAAWQQNFATVLHEASHQTAFNTGIHSRWSPPPRWVAEGLGTMFEARGVADSRSYPNERDRINRGRLNDFKALRATRKPVAFQALVDSDAAFERDPIRAYAEAWALTFYLVEKMPREYARYLEKTASRPAFTVYSRAQRLKDFTDVFGDNLALFDAKMLRYIDGLK